MVLEGASSRSEEDSFSEPPPSSDIDRYAGDTNPTYISAREPNYVALNGPGPNQIYVNLNNLPRPWSLFGTRPQPAILARTVQDVGEEASKALNRPLRQEEADALAFHRANAISLASYGAPLGVSVAFIQAWRRSKTFRFPGWTPGEKFNPNSFGPMKGNAARWLWHSLRFNAYGALGFIVGQVFFGTFAWMSLAAGQLKDPRLKDMVTEIQKIARSKEMSIASQHREREGHDMPGQRPGETYEMSRQRQNAVGGSRGWRTQEKADAGQEDDMSPTGGAFGQEYGNTAVDSGLLSDEEIRRQTARQQSDSQRGAPDNSSTSSQATPGSRSDIQRTAKTDNQTTSTEDKPAGSAWARLRQQASSGNVKPRPADPGRGREQSNSSDSFSFSQTEEDRQLAKSEAQKQFDDRVEREREGKDFDDSRTSQRRW